MSPLQIIKALTENQKSIKNISDKEISNSHYMLNYYLAKDYIFHANSLNLKSIDKKNAFSVWKHFFANKKTKYLFQKAMTENENDGLSNYEREMLKNNQDDE